MTNLQAEKLRDSIIGTNDVWLKSMLNYVIEVPDVKVLPKESGKLYQPETNKARIDAKNKVIGNFFIDLGQMILAMEV